jgi:hypothetical protein
MGDLPRHTELREEVRLFGSTWTAVGTRVDVLEDREDGAYLASIPYYDSVVRDYEDMELILDRTALRFLPD